MDQPLPAGRNFHLPWLPRGTDMNLISRFQHLSNYLESPTQVYAKRSPDSTTSSSGSATTTCKSTQGSDTCQKPTNTSAALPIALGVLIPLICSIIAFIYLHRRYKQRLRREDRQDAEKYKSMDFGMDLTYRDGKKGSGKRPEMTDGRPNPHRQMKGLSLDPVTHTFLFPESPAKASTDSLHSMARAGGLDDSRYRHAGLGGEGGSRSTSPNARMRADTDSSVVSPMSEPNANLLQHAQSVPVSLPPRGGSLAPNVPAVRVNEKPLPSPAFDKPLPSPSPPKDAMLADSSFRGLAVPDFESSRDSYFSTQAKAIRKSNTYLQAFIRSGESSEDDRSDKASDRGPPIDSGSSTMVNSSDRFKPIQNSFYDMEAYPTSTQSLSSDIPMTTQPSVEKRVMDLPPPPGYQSREASLHNYTNSLVSVNSNFTDILKTPRESATTLPPVPAIYFPARGQSLAPAPANPIVEEDPVDSYLDGLDVDEKPQRLSILMRPLPPEEVGENPEERANRIRSFYKEYFDDSKPFTSNVPLPEPQVPSNVDYYEDYGSEYLNGGTVYDAETGTFVVAAAPFAEPVTRRAMTPPPRAPPRFQSRPRAGSSSTMRSGQYPMPPRGQSAMSHRSRAPPRRQMPPPTMLKSLPTPHLLKDDTAIFGAADFAPPPSFRDIQAGRRPDSPLGVRRPYSPAVRAHVPLASSFEDLSSIPSPHALRQSGLYTSLDFAPPSRFRNVDSGSDASSMRSGRSGMSSQQLNHLRAGAYRMSRIPRNLAGTKDDIMSGLKPSWDLR